MAEEEILSQDEINSLIDIVGQGYTPGEDQDLAGGPAEAEQKKKKYKKHDFSRPGVVAKDHVRGMGGLHQQFARLFSSSLSSMLRSLVDVEFDTADQLTFGDFIMSLQDPSCLCKLTMTPLPGTVIMEISPDLVFPTVEKLLGGEATQNTPLRRMTEIEKVIIEQMVNIILKDLSEVWKKAKDNISFRLDSIETEPDHVQVMHAADTVILVVMSIKFGHVQGMISICFPFNIIERAWSGTSYDEWLLSSSFAVKDEEYKPCVQERVNKANVWVRAVLPKTIVRLNELQGLNVGDLIQLDVEVQNKQIKDSLIVEVEGKPRFLAKLGQIRKKRAIKITGLVEEDD